MKVPTLEISAGKMQAGKHYDVMLPRECNDLSTMEQMQWP